MKATMTAACLATVCALAASAQTQGQGQQQQGQTRQTQPQQRPDTQSVTLSGCVERDTAAAATAQQQQQQQQAATQAFKLTDITVLSGAEHLRTAGQQQQQREENKEVRLTASAGVNLSQHVGHEVEVMGRVVGSNPMSTTTPRSTGQAGQTGQTQQQQQQQQQRAQQQEKDKAPLIMVNTIKMTATTCR